MTTYSSNLGLIQPTPADPAVSNVWGALLNENMVLLDSILAGIQTVNCAGSSNVVLTFVNGAASQTNNAIFNCTGLLTGNVVVLFPTGKNKVIIFQNNTTGAFTLSAGVNNGSGSPAGATVSVAAGASAILVSDGTNVTNATGAFFINPTFSGTATFPDAATWTASGISNLVTLGIGCSPSYTLDVRATAAQFNLQSSGGEVLSRIVNSTGLIGAIGDAHDALSNTLNVNDLAVAASGDLFAAWGSNSAFLFWKGLTEVGRWGTDGSLLVGSTTNAGAGAIAATGNITAYYSDDRLKTRTGPVKDAIDKIMSLSAFYYHANDLAVKIGKGVYDASIREVGLSAQEVERVLPEVVAQAPIDPEYKTLRYERITALLVAGIQEQQRQLFHLRLGLIGVAVISAAALFASILAA